MLAIGLLVATAHPKEDLLAKWGKGQVTFIAHGHKGYRGGLVPPHLRARRVQTSWEQTRRAHLSLYHTFLERTDCTHLAIMSESCLPVVPVETAIRELTRGGTLLDSYGAWWLNRPNRAGRRVPDKYESHILGHEQWYTITREDAAALLEHEAEIIKDFKCFADNEQFVGTYLNYLGRPWQKGKTTFVYWHQNSAGHPFTFRGKLEKSSLVNSIWPSGASFARKFDQRCDISVLNSYIFSMEQNETPSAPKRRGRPPKSQEVQSESPIVTHIITGENVAAEINAVLGEYRKKWALAKPAPGTHVIFQTTLAGGKPKYPERVLVGACDASQPHKHLHPQGTGGFREVPFVGLDFMAIPAEFILESDFEVDSRLTTGWGVDVLISKAVRNWGGGVAVDDSLVLTDTPKVTGARRELASREMTVVLKDLFGADWRRDCGF